MEQPNKGMTIKETREELVSLLYVRSGLAIDVIELILESMLAVVHQQVDEAYRSLEKKGGDPDGIHFASEESLRSSEHSDHIAESE